MTDNEMERLYVSQCSSIDWCDGYNSAVDKANIIIERQEIEKKVLKNEFVELIAAYEREIKKVKAKAYKECIEKVKEIVVDSVYLDELDDLLKEMVGEDNG